MENADVMATTPPRISGNLDSDDTWSERASIDDESESKRQMAESLGRYSDNDESVVDPSARTCS